MDNSQLTLAGIDVDELLARLMNNSSLVKILLKKFLEDKNFEHLLSAVESRDPKGVEAHSHALKGMCANLSIHSLFSLFDEQVRLVRTGEYESAYAMIGEIKKQLESARKHISLWLEQ